MKIKYKVLLAAILLLLLPFLVVAIFVLNRVADYHKNNENLHAQQVVSILQMEVTECFENIEKTSKDFSSLQSVKAYLGGNEQMEEKAKYSVDELISAVNGLVQIAIYDSQGTLCPISSSYNEYIYPKVSKNNLDEDISLSCGFSTLNNYVLSNGNKNTFTYSFKIYNGDILAGYGMFYYNVELFEDIIYNMNEATDYNVKIVDSKGNVIKAPFNAVNYYTRFTEFNSIQDKFESVIKNKSIDASEYSYLQKDYIAVGGPVSKTKDKNGSTWGIVATIPMEEFMSNVKEFSNNTHFFVFVFTAVVIVIASILILAYLKPLDSIYTIFEKRAAGDKTVRFNYKGKSDVVKIGNSINVLLDMLNERDECYENLVNMTDNIIFEYNIVKDFISFSDNFNSKFSFRANSLKFEDSFFVNGIVQRSQRADFENFLDRMLAGETCQGEFSFKTIYNDYSWYIVRSAPIKDNEDNIVKIVGAMIDINRAKLREEILLKKASYDSLTQVFNRHTFEVSLMNEYDLSQMRKTKVAVLFIDIDDFKFYNNNYSHALGDETLVFVGKTLKEIVGNNGFVGRYGGDEFVICYSETPTVLSAGELAREIINKLGEGFDGECVNEHFIVKCSIGIAYFTEQSIDADSVIKDADSAMYTVKKNGKSDFSYYSKHRKV